MPKNKIILALESSCDETAAAVIEGVINKRNPDARVLSSVVHSQVQEHRKTGGVVPEVAARAHMRRVLPVTRAALRSAGVTLSSVDYLAVTSGPGLVVSLIVGTEFIKGLAAASGIPLLPTNHMAGHLYSAFYGNPKIRFPVLALVVSGGHTMLMVMEDYFHFKVIGETVDDAAGEAFDKVARLLGLPYPGGPHISKLAEQGRPTIRFPRPMLQEDNHNFSFSGLKTAVLYHLDKTQGRLSRSAKAEIAASFEEAAVDVLVKKAGRAAKQFGCKTIALAGGVAANKRLRSRLEELCLKERAGFIVPPFSLCTDNAAMIGLAAYFHLLGRGKSSPPSRVKADPNWELN